MEVNAAWHAEHRMPENPTFDERVEWHDEHMAACGCSPAPDDILVELELRRMR
ncbi:hypothetical protein [Aeromicrobium sp.]